MGEVDEGTVLGLWLVLALGLEYIEGSGDALLVDIADDEGVSSTITACFAVPANSFST